MYEFSHGIQHALKAKLRLKMFPSPLPPTNSRHLGRSHANTDLLLIVPL